MIRHALHSCTVTATSGSVHGATTRSCLIAPPSFPLVLAADILRAGSEAVDLAAIAVPADKNLRAAATTHKQSARHFIGALRHINPQPSAVSSSLQPRADRACRRARASQGQALRVAAKTRPALTGPARDGCAIWRSGRKNARGAGRTKEWNLRTQYPNRYSTSPHPTGVAMFGIIPDRRSQGFDRCRVFRLRRRRGKPLAPGWMMRLPPRRNQRLDIRRRACHHICLAPANRPSCGLVPMRLGPR